MQLSSLLEKLSQTRKKHSVLGASWLTGTDVISHLIRSIWRTWCSSFTNCMKWYVELCIWVSVLVLHLAPSVHEIWVSSSSEFCLFFNFPFCFFIKVLAAICCGIAKPSNCILGWRLYTSLCLLWLQGGYMLISNSLFTGLGLSRCKACVLVTILKVTDNKIIVVM